MFDLIFLLCYLSDFLTFVYIIFELLPISFNIILLFHADIVHHSPAYSFPAATQRNQPQRPESFLFRAAVRAETNKGEW